MLIGNTKELSEDFSLLLLIATPGPSQQGRPEQRHLLCPSLPGKHFLSFGSEWTHCKCHPSCDSGELPGNSREISPEPSPIEKGVKAGKGDLCHPPMGGVFWTPWADTALSPWPGQHRFAPGAQVPEGWFRRGLVYMGGEGTQASSLVLTGSPGA